VNLIKLRKSLYPNVDPLKTQSVLYHGPKLPLSKKLPSATSQASLNGVPVQESMFDVSLVEADTRDGPFVNMLLFYEAPPYTEYSHFQESIKEAWEGGLNGCDRVKKVHVRKRTNP
jgi:hypothetical protein